MSQRKTIRILLAEDHAVVRVGLTGIFRFESDLAVVAEAETTAMAIEQYQRHRPDVTLMDLRMPGGGGIVAMREILRIDPRACILMLTTYDTEQDVLHAIEAGARGYLLKDIAPSELVAAIRRAARGEECIPPGIAARLAESKSSESLSARELEVLVLLAKGLTNRELGSTLGMSEFTAKTHVSHILGKLDAADRAEAVGTAIRRGIIEA